MSHWWLCQTPQMRYIFLKFWFNGHSTGIKMYGKPEGPNQPILPHTGNLCRRLLWWISSSYITIIILYTAILGSKRMQRNFVWDTFIVFLHKLCSAQHCSPGTASGNAKGGGRDEKLIFYVASSIGKYGIVATQIGTYIENSEYFT